MILIRDDLFLGKLWDTLHLDHLQANHIGAMLQLCDEVPQEGIPHLYLGIRDGEQIPHTAFQQGLRFVQEQRAAGQRVLIACGAGISRSPTFAVACLKEAENRTLLDAYREVLSRHSAARPHPQLWRFVCDFYGEPFSLGEMVKVYRSLTPKS
jgi:hypothetical protein